MINVGVINTGWWADAMYLPALKAHSQVKVTAVCGRNPVKAAAFAALWNVPNHFTDVDEMINSGVCDAIVVASHTDNHHPQTIAALNAGLHVLCEKPMATSVAEATEMHALAKSKGLKTMIPFTYRFMAHNRYMKQLIENDYIGDPYHLNIRYYHDFGRNPGYGWGWNRDKVGAGDLANLGSHPIYLAYWYFGEVESVTAELNQTIDRGSVDPDGKSFTANDDNGLLTLRFKNGAMGSIHYSSLSYETTSAFKQQHYYDFHGSKGSLYHKNNWHDVQETIGATVGEELHTLTVPDEIWGNGNIPGNVHESYKTVFRKDGHMVGEFIDSILNDTEPSPSFADGLAVQKIIAAAEQSSAEGKRISIQ
ncbi:MAG: Gfo/Idh/MocA family protein [Anaerolineae bacterium]